MIAVFVYAGIIAYDDFYLKDFVTLCKEASQKIYLTN
jgi:hypothetical protein